MKEKPGDITCVKVGKTKETAKSWGSVIVPVIFHLETPPEVPARQKTLLKGAQPVSGATVVNLSPAVAEERGLNQLLTGVIIIGIEKGSPAARIGFRPGDIVLQINKTRIVSVLDLIKSTRYNPTSWHLIINRNGQRLTMMLPG